MDPHNKYENFGKDKNIRGEKITQQKLPYLENAAPKQAMEVCYQYHRQLQPSRGKKAATEIVTCLCKVASISGLLTQLQKRAASQTEVLIWLLTAL